MSTATHRGDVFTIPIAACSMRRQIMQKSYRDHTAGRACRTIKLDPPLKLVYSESLPTVSDARKREAQIKRWTRAKKEGLVEPAISINTLAYEGYGLTTALQEIAKIGIRHVELGYTRGFTEGLTEGHFSETSAVKINRLLSDLGLSSIALSAHIDLTTEKAVDELKRRIDFGKALGARIVNTKVGARSGRKKFEKNIEPIAEYAESMNVIIGLENPAEGTDQIITSGETGAAVIEKIGSDFIKLNYDFGNAFTYSKGAVDPASDYKIALPHACYLHLKDLKKMEEGWVFAQIGDGVVNYDSIFRELALDKKLLPFSIEHLFIYTATSKLTVQRKAKAPELDRIRMILKASFDYVKSFFNT